MTNKYTNKKLSIKKSSVRRVMQGRLAAAGLFLIDNYISKGGSR